MTGKPQLRPMPNERHGLYFHAERFEIPPNSQLGRLLKSTVSGLLERFPVPAPLPAQALAQRLAYKLIRAASFEAHVLQSGEAPTVTADANYLHLAGSIRADLIALWSMSKDGPPPGKPPDLNEYLKRIAQVDKDEQ